VEGDELGLRPVLDSLRRRPLILLLFAPAGALSALLLTRFFMQLINRPPRASPSTQDRPQP